MTTADVVVVGGGCAGVVAAVAAARAGARTMLVEREGTLGGTSTGVLDTFYGFFPPGDDEKRVVGGIPFEIVERLTVDGNAFLRPNTYGAGTGVTYSPEVLRALWDEVCAAAGVEVLLHSNLMDVACEGGPVSEMLFVSGSELLSIPAGVAIDASGDGVLAHLAGAQSEGYGDILNPQNLTVTFTMAPVDEAALKSFGRPALVALMKEAAESGDYDLPRTDGSLHRTTVPGTQLVHMTRVAGRDPREPAELSRAEAEGRAQVMEYARFLRERVPGFEHARIAWMARRGGIRESRRVRGRYWLTRDDVVEGARFTDAVAQGAAPIEEHGKEQDTKWEFIGRIYDIPYRCLIPAGVEGMLVAGRCFSASHDAHASARNMAQCMAMGQAAGTAAALAADKGVEPGELDSALLRRSLLDGGALFGGATE